MNYQFPRPRMLQMKSEPNWASGFNLRGHAGKVVDIRRITKILPNQGSFIFLCGGEGGGRARGGVGRGVGAIIFM